MRHLAIAACVVAWAMPLSAEAGTPVCDRRDKFIQNLRKLYSEDLSAIGVTADGKVMELLVSDKGTWTLLLTAPSGRSCAVTAGRNWKRAPDDPENARYSAF